jgi:hypothetical protein
VAHALLRAASTLMSMSARRRDESRRSRLRVRATGRLHDLWWASRPMENSLTVAVIRRGEPGQGRFLGPAWPELRLL